MTELRCVIGRDTEGDGSTVRRTLIGRFDRTAAHELKRILRDELVRRRPRRLVIDMGGVEYLGADCVRILLGGYTKALTGGHGFEVVNAHGQVREVLESTGLCGPSEQLYALPPDVVSLPWS